MDLSAPHQIVCASEFRHISHVDAQKYFVNDDDDGLFGLYRGWSYFECCLEEAKKKSMIFRYGGSDII